jgi:hypothetical protein
MMAAVRRFTAFVLALVVSLWIPVRATAIEREALPPGDGGSLSAQPPPESTVLAAAVYSAPGGSWHSRQAHHSSTTPAWLPGAPDFGHFDTSPVPETVRSFPPRFRIYPLLI